MSKSKDSRIKTNEEEIERLHTERRHIFSTIAKIKDEEEFMETNRKCTELLGKINVLEKKNYFMKNNLPPNGVADLSDEVTILD
jgi:hypothetical protein